MEKFQHRHTEACVWKTYPSGQQSCVTAKNERERFKRANGTFKPSGNPDRWRRQPTDGLEDEYGPVPARVRDRDWYDEVIVLRVLNQEAPGRNPYRLEWEQIVKRMDLAQLSAAEVADVVGVTERYVMDLRRIHG